VHENLCSKFELGNNKLVMSACFNRDGTPALKSNWEACNTVMEKAKDQKPWFGIEQEYTLFDYPSMRPLGWPEGGTLQNFSSESAFLVSYQLCCGAQAK
jgi:glutamine synthetase